MAVAWSTRFLCLTSGYKTIFSMVELTRDQSKTGKSPNASHGSCMINAGGSFIFEVEATKWIFGWSKSRGSYIHKHSIPRMCQNREIDVFCTMSRGRQKIQISHPKLSLNGETYDKFALWAEIVGKSKPLIRKGSRYARWKFGTFCGKSMTQNFEITIQKSSNWRKGLTSLKFGSSLSRWKIFGSIVYNF